MPQTVTRPRVKVTDRATSTQLNRPPDFTRQFYWLYLGAFVALHSLALLAFVPWVFSWTGVVSVFIGNYIFGALGINLAYHRLLTHRGG